MTPPELIALLRRQWKAAAIIFVAALAGFYILTHKNPGYADTAQINFIGPSPSSQSMLVVEELTGWYLMSGSGHNKVHAGGGTAAYDVAFYNAYNEEYPNYSEPYLFVTAKSNDPAAAERTLQVALKVLNEDLRNRQLAAGAPVKMFSKTEVMSLSGPVSQGGSHLRTLVGISLLAGIAILWVTSFLDRRRIRRAAGLPVRAS